MFMGGCECREIMSKWPYYQISDDLKQYYMIQLAHHFYSLVELGTGIGTRADIPEMALHHIATVSAMMFSYFTNQIACGITVLAAHNIGDIWINFAKFSRDLQLVPGMISNVIYLVLVFTWSVPRVFMISLCVLPAVFYTRHFDMPVGSPDFEVLR